MASDNSGVTTLTADGCAGCHRAHTAQGEGLLTAASEEDLCLSCHNATANGAATDVVTGVQYVKGEITGGKPGAILGFLRDGGFQSAHLGSASDELMRVGYYRATDAVSFRMKVPSERAAEPVTSAHVQLPGMNAAVTGPSKVWGYGATNSGAGPTAAAMGCTSCHNPHGNGQYRILSTLNTNSDVVTPQATAITNSYAATDRIFTNGSNNLIAGDIVTITGNSSVADGTYIVKSIAGNAFTVAAVTNTTDLTANIANATFNIASDGTGGSVVRKIALVNDAPLPAAGDTRNYTIMQVKGTQGTDSSYLLYESNVLSARASGSFNGVAGLYNDTAGDYFHRTVPWNPAVNAPASNCNTTNGTLPAACGTANDAPNGRPATTTSQIAYNDQITAWCSTCHTRYYSATNPNPGDEPNSSVDAAKTVASYSGQDIVSPAGATFGFALGDTVTFSAGAANNEYFVVYTATAGSGASAVQTIRVSATAEGAAIAAPVASGTVTRLYPFSSSSWYFPRPGDDLYKFQHQTTTNRACTTCHVGHGTDAAMQTTGSTTFSNTLQWPDGTNATSGYNSRLLKIDNRGTCQACHDPTGTASAGQQLGSQGTPYVP